MGEILLINEVLPWRSKSSFLKGHPFQAILKRQFSGSPREALDLYRIVVRIRLAEIKKDWGLKLNIKRTYMEDDILHLGDYLVDPEETL